MRTLLLGSTAFLLATSLATAQTTPAGQSTGAPPPAGASSQSANANAAASGDTNQAVATTSANADQPAKGSNSFTQGQALQRIEHNGYTQVTGLAKDKDGVWRGAAQKDGQPVRVWLDYKGNVGQTL